MKGSKLLEYRNEFVHLELRGPAVSARGMVGTFPQSSRFKIVAHPWSEGQVNVTDATGLTFPWQVGEFGPALFEETEYRLWVHSLVPGQHPRVGHRDPTILASVDDYHETFTVSGPINFRSQIGLSDFRVAVGARVVILTVEVFPTKIDYASDYDEILSEIAAAARALAFANLRATYRSGSAQEADDASDTDWITLLRNEIQSLTVAHRHNDARPHRSLLQRIELTPVRKVRRMDSVVRQAVLRQRGSGSWQVLADIGPVRINLPARVSDDTLDTPEHRWLRLNLALIADRLRTIRDGFQQEQARWQRRSGSAPLARLSAEIVEAETSLAQLGEVRALSFLEGITAPPPPGFSSLKLLSAAGYGEAHRAISVLRLGLSIDAGTVAESVLEVQSLYETWCFIEIVRLVIAVTHAQADLSDLLKIERAGVRLTLARGRRSAVRCEHHGGTVTVTYNHEFDGLTGVQKPDVVVRIDRPGWPSLIVLFDAKYRVHADKRYVERFGLPGPPQDAINALHRYRDAIVIETGAAKIPTRPVVKGVALYPLSHESSADYLESRLAKALQTLGIGAIPFLPSNTGFARQWLSNVLAMTTAELAEPGLPFSGLAAKAERWRPPPHDD